MPGDKESKALQGHLVGGDSLEGKRRRRILNEPNEGYWPCSRSGGHSEVGDRQRFPPLFIQLTTSPAPLSKEVSLPVLLIQNVLLSMARRHPWWPDHHGHPKLLLCYLPPHTAAALCPGPWLQSLFLAETLVGTRNKQNKWPILLWPSFQGRASIYRPSRAGQLQGERPSPEAQAEADHGGEENSPWDILGFTRF